MNGHSGTSINRPRGGYNPRQIDKWYVDSTCVPFLGTWVEGREGGSNDARMYAINTQGEFIKHNATILPESTKYNILYLNYDEAISFDGKTISWQEKLAIRERKGYNPFTTSINPIFNKE